MGRTIILSSLIWAAGCNSEPQIEPTLCANHKLLAEGKARGREAELMDAVEARVKNVIRGSRTVGGIATFECPKCDRLAQRAIEMGY